MTHEKLKNKLQGYLSPSRFEHCERVAQTAKSIAKIAGIDEEKAFTAGLLHDVCREMEKDELQKLIDEGKYELNEDEKNCAGIWHAFAGPVIGEKEFGIHDEEILEAMRYHSMGNPDMGNIAKVVYLADILEPQRRDWHEHEDILKNIQELLKESLDDALKAGLAYKIHLSLSHGTCILQRSVALWNQLVSQ